METRDYFEREGNWKRKLRDGWRDKILKTSQLLRLRGQSVQREKPGVAIGGGQVVRSPTLGRGGVRLGVRSPRMDTVVVDTNSRTRLSGLESRLHLFLCDSGQLPHLSVPCYSHL